MLKRYWRLFVIFGLFSALSMDGKHYWHEARFLFASTQFSIDDLLTGTFNPHQLGGVVDERGAGGFYLTKVLHMSMLRTWFKGIPPHQGGFESAIWLSLLLVVITSVACTILYDRLMERATDPLLGTLCFLAVPLAMYLAGKLLSEVPSLLFVSISILLFKIGVSEKSKHVLLCLLSSGLFLLLTVFTRLDMIICFIGFLLAEIAFAKEVAIKNKILKNAMVLGLFVPIVYVAFIHVALKRDLLDVMIYFLNFIKLDTKSNLMSIMGIVSFGGVVYAISVFSFLSKRKGLTYYFVTWLGITLIPMILITRNYMVEPRYLASSIIPLGGLGILGSDAIIRKANLVPNSFWIHVVFAGFLLMNKMIVNVMPYELDSRSLNRAMQRIAEEDRHAAVLIPYAYTDFHYLKIMYPHRQILNVNAPDGKITNVTDAWKTRLRNWYGRSYIDSESALETTLKDQDAYYVGWGKYPPAQRVIEITRYLNLTSLSDAIDRLPLKNHLAESWMWHDPTYQFKSMWEYGQYKIFRVVKTPSLN